MPLHQAVVLGAVQGLGEFLPISSSGHLILARALLRWPDAGGLYFDIALHGGTLLALLVYFRAVWIDLLRCVLPGGSPSDRRLLGLLVLATIPGAIAGKLLEKAAEEAFRQPGLVAAMLIVVGLLMAAAERWSGQNRRLPELRARDAAATGLAQCLALVPGASRSGTTMAAALALGLDRETAARWSFFMATPIIAGAVLLGALHIHHEGVPPAMAPAFAAGIATSAVVGWIAIAGFLRFLRSHSLNALVAYRVAAGLVVLALSWSGYFR